MRRASRERTMRWSDGQEQEEAFRILRANLQFVLNDLERPIVLVTSAAAGEGKTASCTRLAQSMASAGWRVVLVDLDLRHPDAHRWVGAHNEFGVSDILVGDRTLEEALQFVQVSGSTARGMYFLSAGRVVQNPTELLSTARLSRLLDRLCEQADMVLIDAPPVLPVADTLVIGRMAAGAILVTASRDTTTDAALRAKDALTRSHTRLLGVVLNKLQTRDTAYRYGYGPAPDGAAANGQAAEPPR